MSTPKPDPATDGAQKEIIGLINSYQDTTDTLRHMVEVQAGVIQAQADKMESLESRIGALEAKLEDEGGQDD